MNTSKIIEEKNILEKIKFIVLDSFNTAYKKRLEFFAENAINAICNKNKENVTNFDDYNFNYYNKTKKEIEFLDNFLYYAKILYEQNNKSEKKELLDIQKYYKKILETEHERQRFILKKE